MVQADGKSYVQHAKFTTLLQVINGELEFRKLGE
jgi:hypothetical protein